MDINIVVTVVGSLMVLAGVVAEAYSFTLSTLVAYAGMLVLHLAGCINLTHNSLIFWGVASLLAAGIAVLSPKEEPDGTRRGTLYLLLGAIAGLLVGLSIDASVMILSAILGTIMGQLFYARTPRGKWVRFSFSIFIHYLCAVGLRIIVSTAIAGITIQGFLRN